MARECIIYSNKYRSGGVPDERDFNRLYNLFNDSDDLLENASISDITTPLIYEQFTYSDSEWKELSRTVALFGTKDLGDPWDWTKLLGLSLEKAIRAALIIQVLATRGGGRIDYSLFDTPGMRDVYARAAPRSELEATIRAFSATVAELKQMGSSAPEVPEHSQRFAYNPLTSKPLVQLDDRGVWAPQHMLIPRSLFPANLYYLASAQWGNSFTNELGGRVERYVGLQLSHLEPERLIGEIPYGKGKKSVDWIIETSDAIILVECKSARMTLGSRAADDSLPGVVERYLGKARRQLAETRRAIREEERGFPIVSRGKRIIELIVTAEPFYLGNSLLPEYGRESDDRAIVISLSELEDLVCLGLTETQALLERIVRDEVRREWHLGSLLREYDTLRQNPVLQSAWEHIGFGAVK